MAGLIAPFVTYTPAVEYAGAHFKALERYKIKALKRVKGDFYTNIWISYEGLEDILR